MKNNKGFTLVELLLVIVIMGIITAISIPLIRNIREGNEDKQYTTYTDSLKQSAKLYLNSYEEDVFGREESGCAIVTYKQLKESDLIKDIPIDKTTCEGEETFVKIVKKEGKYTFTTSIVCKEKKQDGNYTETYREPKEEVDNC